MGRQTMNRLDVLVLGGGPAGMMAAIAAAENGAAVGLLEPNTRLGKKLNITGKGRCNLTKMCPRTAGFSTAPFRSTTARMSWPSSRPWASR